MIVLDTSVLVGAMSGEKRAAPALRRAIERGEWLLVPTLVLYEWLRGPRRTQEVAAFEALFSGEWLLPFTPAEAAVAARLYNSVPRPRGREIDLAIAAHAITHDSVLWTLNPADFADLPGVRLYPTVQSR